MKRLILYLTFFFLSSCEKQYTSDKVPTAQQRPIEARVEYRFMSYEDQPFLNSWLQDPDTARWFLISNAQERDFVVKQWMSYIPARCGLTALKNGIPVGICTLYLQPFSKLSHQADFGIVVAPHSRGEGIGSGLLENLIHLAKTDFEINLLHLQVCEGNPAIHLYQRFGFKEFGRQSNWIKEGPGSYSGRIFLEKDLSST